MNNIHNFRPYYLYGIVAVVAIIPRFLFIFFAPDSTGDGEHYSRIAENILSGCGVSISMPQSGECIPHFGGNHGPGYPMFIATVFWISGHSDFAVRIAQAMVYVTSLIYLVDAVHRYTLSSKLALFSGLILAISPLQVAWPRFLYTETLALAGTLWLFAELLKSIHESRLRVIPIAFALIATTFIRLDGVLLVVPVAAAGFIIHRPFDAIRRGLVIALILGLPWGGWILRNIDVGLKDIFMPPELSLGISSQGYVSWTKIWVTNQYQAATTLWPLGAHNYDGIRIDDHAYSSKKEKEKLYALLDELKKHKGETFPKHIDDQFAVLAKEAIERAPIKYYLLNPIHRVWNLWSNIYDSFAWPIGMDNRLSGQEKLDFINSGLWSKLILIKKYPVQIFGKIFVNGWRLVIYLLFIFSIWIVCKDKNYQYRDLMVLALSFVAARSIFSAIMSLVETRYIIMQMPVLELVVVLVVATFLIGRKNIKFPA